MSTFNLLINGKQVPGDLTMEVINPASEKIVALSPRASEKQLDVAVRAAQAAFPAWSSTPIARRRDALRQIGEVM